MVSPGPWFRVCLAVLPAALGTMLWLIIGGQSIADRLRFRLRVLRDALRESGQARNMEADERGYRALMDQLDLVIARAEGVTFWRAAVCGLMRFPPRGASERVEARRPELAAAEQAFETALAGAILMSSPAGILVLLGLHLRPERLRASACFRRGLPWLLQSLAEGQVRRFVRAESR
jgi:hypothetical protein